MLAKLQVRRLREKLTKRRIRRQEHVSYALWCALNPCALTSMAAGNYQVPFSQACHVCRAAVVHASNLEPMAHHLL